MLKSFLATLLLVCLTAVCLITKSNAEVTLFTADGKTDTYTLLGKTLGNMPVDSCDCSHPAFGHHITQVNDTTLNKPVFSFFIHVTPDNDRCKNFDRQRNEIKVWGPSPEYLKGAENDTMEYKWKFKLANGFRPSPDFCHVHQIKEGLDISEDGAPLITITPRLGSPDIVQLIHVDSAAKSAVLFHAPLSAFEGIWVEATERAKFGRRGSYSIDIKRVSDGVSIFSYSANPIDLWVPVSSSATFFRPKWGIYRSLNAKEDLRDEQVLFDDFCIAKNSNCP